MMVDIDQIQIGDFVVSLEDVKGSRRQGIKYKVTKKEPGKLYYLSDNGSTVFSSDLCSFRQVFPTGTEAGFNYLSDREIQIRILQELIKLNDSSSKESL